MTAGELGEAAYLAFCRRYHGENLPAISWSRLGKRRRAAWSQVGTEMRKLVLEERASEVKVFRVVKGAVG